MDYAGFFLSENKLQIAKVGLQNSILEVSSLEESYFNSKLNLILDNENKILENLQASYSQFLLNDKSPAKSVAFTLPNNLINVYQLPYEPELNDDELLDEIKFEITLINPFTEFDSENIKYIKLQSEGCNELLVFLYPQKMLKLLNKFCKNNGLLLNSVNSTNVALEKLLSLFPAKFKDKTIASIYLDNDNFSLLISKNFKPSFYKQVFSFEFANLARTIEEIIASHNHESQPENIFLSGSNLPKNFCDNLNKQSNLMFTNLDVTKYFKFESKVNTDDSNPLNYTAALGASINF